MDWAPNEGKHEIKVRYILLWTWWQNKEPIDYQRIGLTVLIANLHLVIKIKVCGAI